MSPVGVALVFVLGWMVVGLGVFIVGNVVSGLRARRRSPVGSSSGGLLRFWAVAIGLALAVAGLYAVVMFTVL